MKTIHTTRQINAPLDLVFWTIADVRNFSQAVPSIVRIEFEGDQQEGVGTRFKETREMNGKEVTVPLEITELIPNERVRMVSDTGGTVWDSVFTVTQSGDIVEMHMEMEARASKIMARVINPLIRGMVVKGVEADMDAVKHYCESQS